MPAGPGCFPHAGHVPAQRPSTVDVAVPCQPIGRCRFERDGRCRGSRPRGSLRGMKIVKCGRDRRRRPPRRTGRPARHVRVGVRLPGPGRGRRRGGGRGPRAAARPRCRPDGPAHARRRGSGGHRGAGPPRRPVPGPGAHHVRHGRRHAARRRGRRDGLPSPTSSPSSAPRTVPPRWHRRTTAASSAEPPPVRAPYARTRSSSTDRAGTRTTAPPSWTVPGGAA